jgi:hypothetical protein
LYSFLWSPELKPSKYPILLNIHYYVTRSMLLMRYIKAIPVRAWRPIGLWDVEAPTFSRPVLSNVLMYSGTIHWCLWRCGRHHTTTITTTT